MPGITISHYRIAEKLGEGGMGAVFKALDTRLNRFVALKILSPEVGEDVERRRRFQQEAQAASALNHRNIVTIYDIGEVDGSLFIAMELVAGRTMAELIPAHGMAPSEALEYAVQIADACARAHAAGIVHRDLKPGNLMVTLEGVVKVLDFGLAKLIGADASADTMTASMGPRTLRGSVLGTPAYMSPEQAAGEAVDARSDVFSFGAVLYEMVSGRRAFQGDSQVATIAAVLAREPEPPPESASPELARIILRCLRKERARRFQTMADLKAALEDLREESGSGRPAARAPSRPRWAWAAVPSILLLASAIAWLILRPPPVAETLQATALTTLPGVELAPSLSPEGTYVVFTWTGPKQDNQDLYVQMIGQGEPLRLTTDPRDDYNPVWSPDGRWIAFLRSPPASPAGLHSRELLLKPPLGGPEKKLADIRSRGFYPFVLTVAWSPDSDALIVTDSPGEGQPDALFVVALETGEKRRLTSSQPPTLADTSPAASPDGRSLVFLRRTSWGSGELHLLALGKGLTAAGEPRRLTTVEQRADFPAWMPDSREIVFAARGGLWRLSVRGEQPPTRIPYVGEDSLTPAISRSQPGKPARLVYVRSLNDWNFWRIETPAPGAPSSSAPVLAIASTKAEYHPKFSPDGHRVAFASDRSGEAEIWVSDPDGSNAFQLTSMGALDTNCPQWSPDGQLIAFSSIGESEWDIYVVPVTGGKPRRLTSHPAIDLCPTFSRDGEWIYFSSQRTGEPRIWKMPAAGGEAFQVSPNQGVRSLESPDGRDLYYLKGSMESPMWRLPTSGGDPVEVLDRVLWFNFWVLEKGAYYIDRVEGETRLQYLDFASGKPTTVARNLGEVGWAGLTASPDGRTILFTRVDASTDDLMLVEDFR